MRRRIFIQSLMAAFVVPKVCPSPDLYMVPGTGFIRPYPRQFEIFKSDEVLYGGFYGGGKSYANLLLMDYYIANNIPVRVQRSLDPLRVRS